MTTTPRNRGKRLKRKRYNPYTVFFFICCVLLLASVLLNVRAVKLVNSALNQTKQAISVAEDAHLLANQAIDKLMAKEWAEAEIGYGYPYEEHEAYVDYVAAEYLASVTWGEARGCSVTEQAAVMWCVLNRVDSPLYPDSVVEVITQKSQFNGYSEDNPITNEMLQLANSVLTYWSEGMPLDGCFQKNTCISPGMVNTTISTQSGQAMRLLGTGACPVLMRRIQQIEEQTC